MYTLGLWRRVSRDPSSPLRKTFSFKEGSPVPRFLNRATNARLQQENLSLGVGLRRNHLNRGARVRSHRRPTLAFAPFAKPSPSVLTPLECFSSSIGPYVAAVPSERLLNAATMSFSSEKFSPRSKGAATYSMITSSSTGSGVAVLLALFPFSFGDALALDFVDLPFGGSFAGSGSCVRKGVGVGFRVRVYRRENGTEKGDARAALRAAVEYVW